jgi:hypothetical protein
MVEVEKASNFQFEREAQLQRFKLLNESWFYLCKEAWLINSLFFF